MLNFIQMPKEDGEVMVRLVANGKKTWVIGRGHCINGTTFYCNRDYVPYWLDQHECIACQAYKDGFQKEGASKLPYHKLSWLRSIKPFERYYFLAVERGQESKGLQILNCGRQLHSTIMCSLSTPVVMQVPTQGFWDKLIWGRYQPFVTDLMDLRYGRDLRVVRKVGGEAWMHGQKFPDYSKSAFIMEKTYAGDIFQIEEWGYQAKNIDLRDSVRVDSQKDIKFALSRFDSSFAECAGGAVTITGGAGGKS